MPDRKQFIPGIYNYCDRWCERCAFTGRCRNYQLIEKATRKSKGDLHNDAFWKELSRVFETTKRLILRDARRRGIDLTSPEAIATMDRDVMQRKARRKRVAEHPVVAMGQVYAKSTKAWFDSHAGALDLLNQQIRSRALADVPADPAKAAERDAAGILDALEVIHWYQLFIGVKLTRALSKHFDDTLDDDDPLTLEVQELDSLGSAKVALVAIDRSLAAWHLLREAMEQTDGDAGDAIIDLMLLLDRIRRQAERSLPKARAFRRVGLDD